jgi:hypothetical protein
MTHFPLKSILLTGLPLLITGCVDPKTRLTDFENAVIDGAVMDARIDAGPRDVPDISGPFYVAFATVNVDPTTDNLIKLIWDFSVTKDELGQPIAASLTTQTLDIDTRTPVGAKTMKDAVPISAGGELLYNFENFTLPPRTTFLRDQTVVLTQKIAITIKSKDVICGVVPEGMTISPNMLNLAGSTFVGVRIPPGTIGDALPPELVECPQIDDTPDAGIPDAGVDAAPDAT